MKFYFPPTIILLQNVNSASSLIAATEKLFTVRIEEPLELSLNEAPLAEFSRLIATRNQDWSLVQQEKQIVVVVATAKK